MKVDIPRQNIERQGVLERIQCTMTPTANSFQMLARQYTNPIKAILQEIGANAADSHARVGKSKVPFKVVLPSKIDPHLRIRDYGVGMTDEVMRNVYANYMKSDKQHTNDETGYFGIGSKTPLAYEKIDSFNISTYVDGKMGLYTMGYNEVGIPELNFYGFFDTDEPNGVEISFSVPYVDHAKFKEEAARVYSFFSTRPKIYGSSSFQFEKFEKAFEGSNWYLIKNQDARVVMGNIAYPIAKSTFGVSSFYAPSSPEKALLNDGIHIEVPMGAVSITPSRESLEYNEKTIKVIKENLDKAAKELDDQVAKELQDCRSDLAKFLKLYEYKTTFSYNFDSSGVTKQLPEKFSYHKFRNMIKYKYYRRSSFTNKISRSSHVYDFPTNYNSLKNSVVVIQDIEKGFERPCRKLAEDTGKNVYLIHKDQIDKVGALMTLHAVDEDGIVFNASGLPKPPKKLRATPVARNKGVKKVLLCCPYADSRTRNTIYDSRYWEKDHEIEYKKGTHIYLKVNNYSIKSKHNGLNYNNVRSINIVLTDSGIGMPKVIGLNSDTQKLADRKNFIELGDWIDQQLKKKLTKKLMEDLTNMKTSSEIQYLNEIDSIAKEVSTKSDFSELADMIKASSKKSQQTLNNLYSASNLCGYNLVVQKDEKLAKKIEECEQKYPLLFTILQKGYECGFNLNIKELAQYIEVVDNYKKV